jgi:hypothetical protein
VLTATDIMLCPFLPLEDGMLVKYDEVSTLAAGQGVYIWSRLTTSPFVLWRIIRDATPGQNFFRLLISNAGCTTLSTIPQPIDEALLDDISVPLPDFFGPCDDDQPFQNLRAQSYATVDEALADYPDLQDWDWPPY